MDEKQFEKKLEKLRAQGRVVNGFGIKVRPKKNKRLKYILYLLILIISIFITGVKRKDECLNKFKDWIIEEIDEK